MKIAYIAMGIATLVMTVACDDPGSGGAVLPPFTTGTPNTTPPPPVPSKVAPEVEAILQKKMLIERVSDDLTNPYFDLVHFNPKINTPQHAITPIPADDLKPALRYGYRHVVMKPGHEKMDLPRYVIFHEPIAADDLKKQNYKEFWVDNSTPAACDNRNLVWCSSSDKECHKTWGNPDTELPKIASDVLEKNSEAHPACKPSLLINAICHGGSHWADPQLAEKSIIRVKGGRYEDPYLFRLCNNMILTNTNNDSVVITSFTNVSGGTPEGQWQQIDPATNIWAVKWDKRANGIGTLILNDDSIAHVQHYDTSTIAPDHHQKSSDAYYEPAMVDVPAPAFHWVDIHVDPVAKATYDKYVADNNQKGLLPNSVDACTNVAPPWPQPLVNPQDSPIYMLSKHTYNCLKADKAAGPNYCAVKPGAKWKVDPRKCCHWSTPHPALEGGNCEPNYFYITGFKVNKVNFFANTCAKVGAAEKCLVLKLPAGKTPGDYKVFTPMETPYTDNTIHVWSTFGSNAKPPDFPTKNVLIRGVRLQLGDRPITILGHPDLILPSDPYLIRFDGVELANTPAGISVFPPSKRVSIENSYFTQMGHAVYLWGDELLFRNNYIYKDSPGKSVFLLGSPTPAEIAAKTILPYSKRYVLNVTHTGGGLDGDFSGWEVANNVFYNVSGQEVMEPSGEWLAHTRIADNWYDTNKHFGFGICVSGFCYTMKIKDVFVENNQFFAPTYAAITATDVSYAAGSCENLWVRNNIIAEQGLGNAGIDLPTFCKNSGIVHNTITTTLPVNRPGLRLEGYWTGMDNFTVAENLVTGTMFELSYKEVDYNPLGGHNFGPGEFLMKCTPWHHDALLRCGTDVACQKDIQQKMAVRCTPKLNDQVDTAFRTPTAMKAANNYFEMCSFSTNKPANDADLMKLYCPSANGKPSGVSFAAPAERDYHLTTPPAGSAGDADCPHVGACYLDERPALGAAHVSPHPQASGLDPEGLLQLREKSHQ